MGAIQHDVIGGRLVGPFFRWQLSILIFEILPLLTPDN